MVLKGERCQFMLVFCIVWVFGGIKWHRVHILLPCSRKRNSFCHSCHPAAAMKKAFQIWPRQRWFSCSSCQWHPIPWDPVQEIIKKKNWRKSNTSQRWKQRKKKSKVTKIGVYIFPFVVVQLGFEDKMPWGPFRGLLSLLVQGTHFQRLFEKKDMRPISTTTTKSKQKGERETHRIRETSDVEG